MPSLPTYNSKASLTTSAPEAIRSGAEKPYEAVGQVVNVAENMATKWQGAINNMQDTFARAKTSETQTQVLMEATNDTDINGEEGKIKAIQAANTEVLKSVTDAGLRSKLAFELQHEANISAIKIKNIYAQKKLLADNLNTESLLTSYARVGTPEADASAFNLIQGKVAAGFYTPTQGEKLLTSYRLGSVDFAIQSDPSTTQQSPVLKELIKGKNGKYGKLTDEELATKIKDAKINIWRNKNVQKKAEDETYTQSSINMGDLLVKQQLSLSTIENLRKSGQIDSVTAGIFANAVDPEKRTLTEPNENINVMAFIGMLDKGDKLKAADVIKEATKLRGAKGFDDKAYGFVLQEASKIFDREKKGLSGMDLVSSMVVTAAKGIEAFVKTISGDPKALNSMLSSFIEKVKGGEDPNKVKSELTEQQLNTEIENTKLTLPPQAENMVAPDGRVFRVEPDKVEQALSRGLKRATK